MNIPFVDLKSQYHLIKDEVHKNLEPIFENTAYIGGKAVTDFENNFAQKLGVKHCVSCANGTDAIYIALKALGVELLDDVIVPANTWISSSETVTQCGARPIFVDNDENYLIDVNKIEEKITENTKAIIVVHLYGQSADMKRIMEIAKKHRIKVIEDTAQAHFAKFNGQMVGTFGDISTFSFYPGKNLGAYGDAGAIATNNQELADKMRAFANHGQTAKNIHKFEGINSRLDAIQAVVLNTKLQYIDEWNKSRNQNAKLYNKYLSGIEEIVLPKEKENCEHIFHLYVIRVQDRENLQKYLNDNGIATGIHYPLALPFTEAYSKRKHKPENFPLAYLYQHEILSLPMFPELTEEQIIYITNKIKEYYKR